MQTNLEQVTEMIRALPVEDYEKLREVIDEQEKAKIYEWLDEEKRESAQTMRTRENANEQLERFRKAQEWVLTNRDEYMNQWVCLDGDKLIAHGSDALKVHRQAKEAGIEIPYLEQIVEESDWGGW
jgi:hypothetical protein